MCTFILLLITRLSRHSLALYSYSDVRLTRRINITYFKAAGQTAATAAALRKGRTRGYWKENQRL